MIAVCCSPLRHVSQSTSAVAKGGHMAVTVQRQFTSAVTERYQDACVGSAMANGTTLIQFDLRHHDFHSALGTQTKSCWRKESYHVDVHELSTFHKPMTYRFIVAQGSYRQDNDQRIYFTPTIKGVSPSQLMTHEAAAENGDDARQFLQRFKDRGLKVTAAFSDDSHSFTEAITAVYPQARLQADHCHTVKHIWGHLQKSLLSSRRKIKAHGEAHHEEQVMERAKTLWKLRGSLLKKPATLSLEETQALAALEREDAGLVQSFRHIMRQRVNIFDHTHSRHYRF